MKDNNLFLDLCFDPKCRMNEVGRYSGVYQETPENLAEHVTEVTMFSYLIATKLMEDFGEDDISFGVLLERCLLHDIEEVGTGDIPRNTKYASPQIKESLNDLAKLKAKELLDHLQYVSWAKSKEGKEGFILSLSDFLAVAKKCVVEIELRGNLSFMKVLQEVLLFSNPSKITVPSGLFINQESVQYLEKLVTVLWKELRQIYWKHEELAKKYGVLIKQLKKEVMFHERVL